MTSPSLRGNWVRIQRPVWFVEIRAGWRPAITNHRRPPEASYEDTAEKKSG
ncbi:hypothetical protein F2Q68_00013877 [Brassica cretica]|uniref:Uncharacterized protein n=1 Tax=Brassica cretica TaxID=69181 RepID=A0A8S9HYY9_BRACR|nr:hypothetical protein F2Q68_00013877 [Brassica cretica]